MSTQRDNTRLLAMLAANAENKTLRLGMDYVKKALWYGIESGGRTYFLKGGREIMELNQLPDGVAAPQDGVTGSPISVKGIQRYIQGGEANGATLIAELADYFASHAKFQHETIPAVLAHWVVAGYAHMVFEHFPYLSLASAQPACGKTRVLELLSEVGFRAKPLIVNPTAATLYRSLHDSAQVLLIDEFEDSTDDSKRAMISVLNSGFLRGGTVPRCVGQNYDIKHFHAYSPKAFAGLARIPHALKTRSIPILMMPKGPEDNISPFHPMECEEQLRKWKDDAAIFALSNAAALEAAAMRRGQLEIPSYLEDREVDFMTPLFATAYVAGSDSDALRSFCKVLAGTRRQRAAQGQATKAAEALVKWFPEHQAETKMFLSEAANLLCDCEAIPEPDERLAGDLFRNMGLNVREIRIGDKTRKGVLISRKEIEALGQQFKASAEPTEVLPIAA